MRSAPRRLGPALGASIAAHAVLVAIGVLLLSVQPEPGVARVPPVPTKLVFMQRSGASGGGGGSIAPAAARPIEIPRHRPPMAIPVSAPLPRVEPPPLPVLDAPIQTNAASLLQASGTAVVTLAGPGGGGRGDGLGPGKGPGFGPGEGGNTGGGPRKSGGDVIGPELVFQTKPRYTAAAMQAKIAGDVWLEAVVQADGTVGSIRVIRSLDRVLGLDEEAIRTAKLWRFKPASLNGKPVDVLVTLVLEFRIY